MNNQDLTKLLILGAGASVDVGVYPTGIQFIKIAKEIISICDSESTQELIKEWISEDVDCQRQFVESHIKNDIKKYLKNLINSNHASIDSYISYITDPAEQNFLKSLIISIILASTAYSELYKEHNGNFANSWYSELSKLIFPTLSSNVDDQQKLDGIKSKLLSINIITFNYDISLEIDLLRRVEQYFGSINDKAKEAFELICSKIFHIYGQVAGSYSDYDEILNLRDSQYIEGRVDDFGVFLKRWKRQFREKAIQLWRNVSDIQQNVISEGRSKGLMPNKENYFLAEEAKNFQERTWLELPNLFCKNMDNLLAQKEKINHPRNHLNIFCFLILKNAIKINWNSEKEIKKFVSSQRILVINQDRSNSEVKTILSQIISNQLDLVYILGYGFDLDNNELLNFEKIKNYQKGCFVTNYERNLRLERLIYDEVLYCKLHTSPSNKEYKIPLISHKSVSGALKEFSLLEKPKTFIQITTDLTPYFAMKNNN